MYLQRCSAELQDEGAALRELMGVDEVLEDSALLELPEGVAIALGRLGRS